MNVMAKAKWCRSAGQYTCGSKLMLGPIKVGTTNWDVCRTKGDPLCWASHVDLPGVKTLPRFASEEEAKERVEGVVERWLKAVLGE